MSYTIVRHYRHSGNRRIKRGLTLEEAQAHCGRSDTHGDYRCCTDNARVPHEAAKCPRCGGPTYAAWFDGYEEAR